MYVFTFSVIRRLIGCGGRCGGKGGRGLKGKRGLDYCLSKCSLNRGTEGNEGGCGRLIVGG